MAFDSLSDKLQNIFKNLRGKGRLSEADVKAALKEVKMAFLRIISKSVVYISFDDSSGLKFNGLGLCNNPRRTQYLILK